LTTVTLPRLLTAAAIGIAYYWVAAFLWGYIAAYNPIHEMLLDVLVRRGHIAAYRVIISIHDVIVNLFVALPFAAVFRFLPALRHWTYVALATAASVIAGYASISVEALPSLFSSWVFWVGLAMAGLSLPAAFALLNQNRWDRLHRPGVPDAA